MTDLILEKIRQEKELIVVLCAAVISCIFVPVSDLTEYIDTDTVGLWFSFMIVSAGLRENGIHGKLAAICTKHLKKTRSAAVTLVFLTFFTAPFMTNLMSIVIFAPLTLTFFSFDKTMMMYVLSLQAAAAGLGSMIFPAANLTDLILYDHFNLGFTEYAKIVLPFYAESFLLLFLLCVFVKNRPLENIEAQLSTESESSYYVAIYLTLLALVIFAVTGNISKMTVFASACLVAAIMDPQIFSKIDYAPFIMIIAVSVFTGNLSQIRDLTGFLQKIISDKVYESCMIFSQFIGNLPSAMLFTLFADSPRDLIISANIGGLGFPIASISGIYAFRMFKGKFPEEQKKYFGCCAGIGVFLNIMLYILYKYIIA